MSSRQLLQTFVLLLLLFNNARLLTPDDLRWRRTLGRLLNYFELTISKNQIPDSFFHVFREQKATQTRGARRVETSTEHTSIHTLAFKRPELHASVTCVGPLAFTNDPHFTRIHSFVGKRRVCGFTLACNTSVIDRTIHDRLVIF